MDKQTPVEARVFLDLNNFSIDAYCPACHKGLVPDRGIHYCENCGQRLYWSNSLYINGKLVVG